MTRMKARVFKKAGKKLDKSKLSDNPKYVRKQDKEALKKKNAAFALLETIFSKRDEDRGIY